MKKGIKFFVLIFLLITIISLVIIGKENDKYEFEDTITYDGKTYGLLEYNMDIFTYNYNSNNYLEEDLIHPINHDKWNVVYFNGDLFILDKQVKNAINYYSNDDNYNWFVVFDKEDSVVKKNIDINNDEISYLYNMDNALREKTITFDEIDMFADIMKFSKDGLVQGIITLAQVDGYWYYKTEVMTEDDREYVIGIVDSLNEKINFLLDE